MFVWGPASKKAFVAPASGLVKPPGATFRLECGSGFPGERGAVSSHGN